MTSTMSMRSRLDNIPAASSGRQPSPKRSFMVQLPPPQPPQPPPPPQLPPLQDDEELQPDPPHPDEVDFGLSSNCRIIGNVEIGSAPAPKTAISIAASAVAPPGRIIDARVFSDEKSVLRSASITSPRAVRKGL